MMQACSQLMLAENAENPIRRYRFGVYLGFGFTCGSATVLDSVLGPRVGPCSLF